MIGVVIVTYNRLEKLKIALKVFDNQKSVPRYVVVVDNASTDGTREYLEKWACAASAYERHVIAMSENSGGSGGFYEGLKAAQEKEADWIWVSDDDAYPEEDALEQAQKYLIDIKEKWSSISAICGQVINQGQIDLAHRRSICSRGITIFDDTALEEAYEKREFERNTFSYIGTIFNKAKLLEAGLPRKDYFIWFDDLEHGLRMSKVGKIYCVPAIKIHHDVGGLNMNELTPEWRWYYRYRNMTDCYHLHFPKKCYYFFLMKAKLKVMLLWRLMGMSKVDRDMLKAGIEDAQKGKFGLHPIYRPGWKG